MELQLTQGPCGPRRLARPSRRTWTDKRRAGFLDNLAATCNVKASCEAIGMSTSGLYQLRLRDPAFGEQWRAALLIGYDRIEELAIRLAIDALSRFELGEVKLGEAVGLPIDISSAISLLKMHDARTREASDRRRVPHVRRATEAETDAAIMKQLAALDRRLRGKKAEGGEDAGGAKA